MFILVKLILSCHLINALNIVEEESNDSNISDKVEEAQEFTSTIIHGDKWSNIAIKDIAYYLRDHKFNEWDRRYYQEKPSEDLIGFFTTFPTPPLRSLHWEVKANCYNNFQECINYLHSIIQMIPWLRVEDTEIVNENVNLRNGTNTKQCENIYKYAQKIGLPFDEPVEMFQWRTTALYYMCWYTMLGTPVLTMIGESCDNFANCLDTDFGNHNYDPRADDKFSFQCAMYSFCPDPCCPIKHVKSMVHCHNNKRNPCFEESAGENFAKRKCQLDRKSNKNFNNIVKNRWNVSCNYCGKGFQWKSEFGMCVDLNECLVGTNKCDIISQNCVNLPGTFDCLCKWGYELDENRKTCIKTNSSFWD